MIKYWLLKSEPDVWSINQQKDAGLKGVAWDGVRNYQAANFLREMKNGDQCFYHSNIIKEIVGIVEIIKEAFPDKTDKKRDLLLFRLGLKKIKSANFFEKIKKNKTISHLPLIKQSRLSVMPIDYKSWKIICKMGKV